jgi:hypothetical protein
MDKRTCLLLSSITLSNVSSSLRHISNLDQLIDIYIKKKKKKKMRGGAPPHCHPPPSQKEGKGGSTPKDVGGDEDGHPHREALTWRKLFTCCDDDDTLLPCCK